MRGVLLTGLPGIGKSTACRKVAELCAERGWRVEGFLTEELRERGQGRTGFDVVELGANGKEQRRAPLARLGSGPGPRVGRYSVSLPEFEELALPILDRIAKVPPGGQTVCIIDEIGKMELFSKTFVQRLRDLLANRPAPLLVTIALHGGGFIAEAKRVQGLELVELSHETRDGAPDDIIRRILGDTSCAGSAPSARCTSVGNAKSEPTRSTDAAKASRWKARNVELIPAAAAAAACQDPPVQQGSVQQQQPASKHGRIVLWLRNELRVADNPLLARGLALARQRGMPLLPVYCYDPRTSSATARTSFGSPKLGVLRRRFLDESLVDLARSFEQRGSQLLICDASPEAVLRVAAGDGGLVLASREACPEELADEQRVRQALRRSSATLELMDPGGITTIFGARELAAAGVSEGERFPEDFRPFYDAVRYTVPEVCRAGLIEPPERFPSVETANVVEIPGLRKAATQLSASGAPSADATAPSFRGGESEAQARVQLWLQKGGLRRYKTTFRRLMGDYSSRLSAHLAQGCISPRRLCARALDDAPSGPHSEHFIYELCWRDFFRHAARRWGRSLFQRGGPMAAAALSGVGRSRDGPERAWRRDETSELRWRHGTTGVPLIDASMRELRATGYLGNLARQFVAAYLIEDQGIDWRVGADWFESTLLDYDPHSNWGQWARSAGVVPTNESKRKRVDGTRYFDIALDLDRGETAAYIRTWVPELARLDDGSLLAPWRSETEATSSEGAESAYPQAPMCSRDLQQYFERATLGGGSAKGGKKGHGGGKASFYASNDANKGKGSKGGKGRWGGRY